MSNPGGIPHNQEAENLRAVIAWQEGEIQRLKDLLRWRKWPEEAPEGNCRVEVYFFTDPWKELVHDLCNFIDGEFCGQAFGAKKLEWRPIGELPAVGA